MNKHLLIYLLLLFLHFTAYSQSEEYKKHLNSVSLKSPFGKTFIYNSSRNKLTTTTSFITYYGKNNFNYKIFHVKETYPAAVVRHGYQVLVIIDSTGKTYLYRDVNKPMKMINGVLYFKHFT